MSLLDYPDNQPNPVVATSDLFVILTASQVDMVPAPGIGHHLVLAGLIITNTQAAQTSIVNLYHGDGSGRMASIDLPAESTLVVPMYGLGMHANESLQGAVPVGGAVVTVLYGVA